MILDGAGNGGARSGSYWDRPLGGITVSETKTIWAVPICRAVTRIVPVYVPAAKPVTLAITKADAGVVPERGTTWIHDALLVANHDTASESGAAMVNDCAGGFDSPSATTKLSPVGATVSTVAALAKETETQRSSAAARQGVSLRESLQRDRMANSARCRIKVSRTLRFPNSSDNIPTSCRQGKVFAIRNSGRWEHGPRQPDRPLTKIDRG